MKKNMGKVSLRRAASLVLAGAAVLLHGCAVVTAPGFDFADSSTRTSVTLGQYVPADANNPPPGVITPITPSLIQAQAESQSRQVSPDVKQLFAEPKPYTIGSGDIVAVVVYDHPELLPLGGQVIAQSSDPTGISGAPGFIVDSDGAIFFPYAGRVKLAGLTESQASELIANRLQRVIKEPQVTVRISSFRSRRAYVEGEVRTPGLQIFTDMPMTLPEAISRAGGILATGDRSFVTLTRNDVTTTIDMMKLQDLGVNPSRILLQNGDLVTVRNRDESKVYVMGEVARPSGIIMHNGRLSLNEALGEAGGPNLGTANTSQIYVIRNGVKDSPIIYHLDAASPTALALADTFTLRPRDVVYIDPVPLVQWNRIISLILPTASAATSVHSLTNP